MARTARAPISSPSPIGLPPDNDVSHVVPRKRSVLARQMARVDDRRAASQFHREEGHVNERPEPRSEFREQGQQATARQSAQDERQRKIDEVVQRMKQQRERDRGDRERG